ncbi:iron complex transport system permease protein [Natranaerovirga hydrolytica]|uniref:Iron complex transport system permease protein n=1 Tax=Natranaerovirga hydrolytica TaxID=680378 RepID=A0A4R1MPS0_9FIRM|nr:iron ABC transporter permease [Natranaerovirga hydrolytica]TCK93324.1 iron complex transport system permease protein [Natranaerovirga hydrolytica]
MDSTNNNTDKKYHKPLFVIGAVILIGLLVIIFSIMKGTVDFSLIEIGQGIRQKSNNSLANQIVHNVRLPRVLTGFLVGMNLAVAGGLLQGVLRNPLASQQVIGVNAGSGLFAVAVMILLPSQIHLIPIGAFLGALFATLLVYGLSLTNSRASTVHIILAGVAISALLNAMTSALMFLNSDELEVTYFWLLGTLSGRSWRYFNILWPYTVLGMGFSLLISPKLNLFALGDELGSSLGLAVKVYRVIAMILASILAGSAVSVTGTIGFVGLIAPHLARLLVGSDYRYLTILSALLGGVLLVLSDTIARIAFQPVELSVGIVTSMLGAPFFLFVLYSKNKNL